MNVLDGLETSASLRARKAALQSAKETASGKRRRIDPSTSDIDYDVDEIEFMMAMQKYKESRRRPFPTWKETLEVLRSLGYRKSKKHPRNIA